MLIPLILYMSLALWGRNDSKHTVNTGTYCTVLYIINILDPHRYTIHNTMYPTLYNVYNVHVKKSLLCPVSIPEGMMWGVCSIAEPTLQRYGPLTRGILRRARRNKQGP
jgi:hypothetical protein